MKKRTIARKLSLEKLTIARLSNIESIRGGNDHCILVGPPPLGPSEGVCTLTGIAPTQTQTSRPTQRYSDNNNCLAFNL
ncbi:class I lanthipeptide [Aquimarina gracilis]|uniref:Class I lanthipeptide n=1 Tax=Aquimarina gracilis TaxID=874422 RepID=A0ABU6A063_9FLAO|nr:class I lanthipeptide [Aquimarina gracilis]MEB3347544.1 class I lanthipeptide [Aquimarina gracilis]